MNDVDIRHNNYDDDGGDSSTNFHNGKDWNSLMILTTVYDRHGVGDKINNIDTGDNGDIRDGTEGTVT